jgi:phage terminase large subunit
MCGGRGSGKSYYAMQKIVRRAATEPKHRMLIVRKTRPAIKNSVWQLAQDVLTREKIRYTLNVSDLSIRLWNGNELKFHGLDDPAKVKSFTGCTSGFIEEAFELTEKEFDETDMIMRDKTGNYKQWILAYNPNSVYHWLNKRFHVGRWPGSTVHVSTYRDNARFIDYHSYHAMMEQLKISNPNLYKISALGEWGELEGLVYTNWQTIAEMPEGGREVYGLDFGFNNPSALVRVVEYDRDLYVDEIIFKNSLTNNDLITIIASKNINKSAQLFCDAAEPARIEELNRAGYNAQAADKAVNPGIDFIKGRRLFVTSRSTNIIKELQSYSWEQKDGKATDRPCKVFDHSLDAMRYAAYTGLNQTAGNQIFLI